MMPPPSQSDLWLLEPLAGVAVVAVVGVVVEPEPGVVVLVEGEVLEELLDVLLLLDEPELPLELLEPDDPVLLLELVPVDPEEDDVDVVS